MERNSECIVIESRHEIDEYIELQSVYINNEDLGSVNR